VVPVAGGGLAGGGLGSYLRMDLGMADRKPFIIGLGFGGLLIAHGTFAYLRRRARQKPVAPGKSQTLSPGNRLLHEPACR
jgi:hypothetical protein